MHWKLDGWLHLMAGKFKLLTDPIDDTVGIECNTLASLTVFVHRLSR